MDLERAKAEVLRGNAPSNNDASLPLAAERPWGGVSGTHADYSLKTPTDRIGMAELWAADRGVPEWWARRGRQHYTQG